MDEYVFTNNGKSTLASGINDSVTSLDVQAGHGALFPNPTGGAYFMCTLVDASGNREIIKVTARSTDTFTVVREQESTTKRAFAADDKVELRVTAGYLTALVTDLLGLVDGSFGNILMGGTLDMDGNELIMDGDGDSSFHSDTDDQIDMKLGGTDVLLFKATVLEPQATATVDLGLISKAFKDLFLSGTLSVDTIAEITGAAGVTIDGVLLKDDEVTTDVINEKTGAAGVTADGVLLKDSQVSTDVINELSGAAGVTIDSLLIKDGKLGTANSVDSDQYVDGSIDTEHLAVDILHADQASHGLLCAANWADEDGVEQLPAAYKVVGHFAIKCPGTPTSLRMYGRYSSAFNMNTRWTVTGIATATVKVINGLNWYDCNSINMSGATPGTVYYGTVEIEGTASYSCTCYAWNIWWE